MTHTTYTLPLTDAQKASIHRAARREQAKAITATIRAAGRAVARLLSTRPARPRPALPRAALPRAIGPIGGRAAGHAG